MKSYIRKKVFEISGVGISSTLILLIAYFTLKYQILAAPVIFLMGFIPVAGAVLCKLDLKRLIPDFIFGALDTGLLIIPAIIGGKIFGVLGAIVGSAVGDAITDGIAGFFEGSIAEWLRSKGIEESRLPLSSAFGKMSGCLWGSGFVLTTAALLGISL